MVKTERLIEDLSLLGKAFSIIANEQVTGETELPPGTQDKLTAAIEQSYLYNPWFIPQFVKFAFSSWAETLAKDKIEKWISRYDPWNMDSRKPATVGIIMAGNIPLVGLHDLLCVLASGNRALIKLSSSDEFLVPAVLEVLNDINPAYNSLFSFSDGPVKNFGAIIATGSNNSSRYFDYYFGKYPHIIRKNRNGVAVLTGEESDEDLKNLADDIFMYFGLGCRNVSKIYVPEGYNFEKLFQQFDNYIFMADHHKYRNNYDYQKSILLINRLHHLDNGFLLVKPDQSFISPISVLHTETYQSIDALNHHFQENQERIQCIISNSDKIEHALSFGQSQLPELWDYADGIDTMIFLKKL